MKENNIANHDSLGSLPDRRFIEELKIATKDLLWLSESEYPLKIVYWHNAENFNVNTLLQHYNYPPETKIVVKEFQSFFASAIAQEEWYNEAEKAETKRYQALVNLMRQNLKNIQVYLLGEIEIDVYILGETPRAIAGLTTKIIAT